MQSVAVGWQIYEITRRPLDLGLVGLAQFLPGLLLFLLGGHVADRFDRRHVLLACYASFALCSLALLAITLHGLHGGTHGVAPIYAVMVAVGLVRVFSGPAGQAFTPLLVPAEVFPNAAAWGSSIFNARHDSRTGDRRRSVRAARLARRGLCDGQRGAGGQRCADAGHPHPGRAAAEPGTRLEDRSGGL